MRSYISFLIIASISGTAISQVGIGTNTPEGALDITSSTAGFIYPVVALTSVLTPTISNPNGGSLAIGTTVYNTATTNIGPNSVYPGIYVWGLATPNPKWIPQFTKRDQKLYVQRSPLRTSSTAGAQNIQFNNSAGTLTSSFIPKYSGTYKVEVKAHYGGGAVVQPPNTGNNNRVNFNAEEGVFQFNFSTISKSFGIRSYSADNRNYATTYTNATSQSRIVSEVILTQGTPYTFTLTCAQSPAPGFVNTGNSGSGQGFINLNDAIKCTIEITYIGE